MYPFQLTVVAQAIRVESTRRAHDGSFTVRCEDRKRRFFFVLKECKRHGKRNERIGGWCVHGMKTMK